MKLYLEECNLLNHMAHKNSK